MQFAKNVFKDKFKLLRNKSNKLINKTDSKFDPRQTE